MIFRKDGPPPVNPPETLKSKMILKRVMRFYLDNKQSMMNSAHKTLQLSILKVLLLENIELSLKLLIKTLNILRISWNIF